MPDVKTFLLRDAQECRTSPAKVGALSLRSPRHREAGPRGSSRLADADAVFQVPLKPEKWSTWQELVESERPHYKATEVRWAAVFDEFKFWPQPRNPDTAPAVAEIHEDIIRFYGNAYRKNGVDRAVQQDQANGQFNILHVAVAALIVMFAFVAGVMAIWTFIL